MYFHSRWLTLACICSSSVSCACKYLSQSQLTIAFAEVLSYKLADIDDTVAIKCFFVSLRSLDPTTMALLCHEFIWV